MGEMGDRRDILGEWSGEGDMRGDFDRRSSGAEGKGGGRAEVVKEVEKVVNGSIEKTEEVITKRAGFGGGHLNRGGGKG